MSDADEEMRLAEEEQRLLGDVMSAINYFESRLSNRAIDLALGVIADERERSEQFVRDLVAARARVSTQAGEGRTRSLRNGGTLGLVGRGHHTVQ